MSHAKNKVEWCLKKAQDEISKGKKHRGIVIYTNNRSIEQIVEEVIGRIK